MRPLTCQGAASSPLSLLGCWVWPRGLELTDMADRVSLWRGKGSYLPSFSCSCFSPSLRWEVSSTQKRSGGDIYHTHRWFFLPKLLVLLQLEKPSFCPQPFSWTKASLATAEKSRGHVPWHPSHLAERGWENAGMWAGAHRGGQVLNKAILKIVNQSFCSIYIVFLCPQEEDSYCPTSLQSWSGTEAFGRAGCAAVWAESALAPSVLARAKKNIPDTPSAQ